MGRIDDLANSFFNNRRLENSSLGSGTETRTEMGTAASDSSGGVVYVVIGDETIPSESLEGEQGTNSVPVPTTVSVKQGDQVVVTLVGSDSVKTPTVTGVVGAGDKLDETIADIEEAIGDIDTSPNYFWNDSNGTHVATTARNGDKTSNILMNGDGLFLRIANKIRTAITNLAFGLWNDSVSDPYLFFKVAVERAKTTSGTFANRPTFSFGVHDESLDKGSYSSVLGYHNNARGSCSVALGEGTVAYSDRQLVIGKYNDYSTSPGLYDVICGDGTDDANRHNAWMISKNGKIRDSEGGFTLKAYELFNTYSPYGGGGTYATNGGTLNRSLNGFVYVEVYWRFSHSTYPMSAPGSVGCSRAWVHNGYVSGLTCSHSSAKSTTTTTNGVTTTGYTYQKAFCTLALSDTAWSCVEDSYGYVTLDTTGRLNFHHECHFKIDLILGYK